MALWNWDWWVALWVEFLLFMHIPMKQFSSPVHWTGMIIAGGVFYNAIMHQRSFRKSKGSSKLYGTSHSLLNAPDQTLWQNMGFWSGDHSFRRACEQLTQKAVQAINLSSEDTLLAFGFGCGEEVKYIQEQFNPRSIRGCTSHEKQHEVAQELCNPYPTIQLDCEDAITWCDTPQEERSDCAVVIDAVYHFNTRSHFLTSLSKHCLKPKGRLALADIILSDSFAARKPRWKWSSPLALMLRLMSVPLCNMQTRTDYVASLEAAGFIEIEVQVVTDHVFPRLADYISDHANVKMDKRWLGFLVFAQLARWWTKNECLEYIIVSATVK